MNKNELIEYIKENASITDLVKIADVLEVELDKPDNINNKYFVSQDSYATTYIKVLDSCYDSENDEYSILKSLHIGDTDITLYDYEIDPINFADYIEISKEKFQQKFKEVQEIINQAYLE